LGTPLLGVYLLGSLAHGGLSRRYSDIDLAFIAEDAPSSVAFEDMQAHAAARSPELASKLSLFWTDRRFSVGRFPLLDRIDYLDHEKPLAERVRVRPARPSPKQIRSYLHGAPFENWRRAAQRFECLDRLPANERKAYLRVLLYPARFAFSWITGRVASNDDAVDFVCERRPLGLDTDLIGRALQCRLSDSDPDPLFEARTVLPQQVEACERIETNEQAIALSDWDPTAANYLIACGLIGEPVAPVITSGGPQKKN